MPEISSDAYTKTTLLSAIGYVCLQWSLLEQIFLYIIFAIEGITLEKGDIIYGSLDWRPRLNMAINLAEFAKVPRPYIVRLKAIRTAIRNEDLHDRRNQVVHGVQRQDEGGISFYMPRWPKGRKEKTLTPLEISALGHRLSDLSDEAEAIFLAIGNWKCAPHGLDDTLDSLPVGHPVTLLERCKDLYARAAHFVRNL